MKKEISDEVKQTVEDGLEDDGMLSHYDFSQAVRGKQYRPLNEGYTVEIEEEDGTITVEHITAIRGAIVLDPDVKEYFPDAEAVNKALRGLIALIPVAPERETAVEENKKAS